MDWAGDKYDAQLIQDIKALFKVLFMFLPLPVFWTLFDQQGSRWVLQAGQMNGYAGKFTFLLLFYFVIKVLIILCCFFQKPLSHIQLV